MENLMFKQMNLSEEIQRAIEEMGFEEATPIQSQAIPHILEGKDIIGQAQTGTGKTGAFGIPVIEKIDAEEEMIQALILCPTRELAIQVAEELKNLAKYKQGIRILPIYGGQPIDRQIMGLKKHPQIVIGTPGRVMDHMRRKTIKLNNLKMLVLDEADEMLNMGFKEDIDVILESVNEERQTIFFSATMSKQIMELTKSYQKDGLTIKATHKELTVPNIEQYYMEVTESMKADMILRILDSSDVKLSVVFCNTKRKVEEVTSHLQSSGYMVEAIHGDMRQPQRDKVMSNFRKGKVDVLVATDVAARGIDVDDIEIVFNYDVPTDEEYYVHRIGRTGRAGRNGKAYTFVIGREIYKLKDIQRYTKANITLQKPPSSEDVEGRKITNNLSNIKPIILNANLAKYTDYIEKFIEEINQNSEEGKFVSSLEISAAFLKMLVGNISEYAETSFKSFDASKRGAIENGERLFINIGKDDKFSPRDIANLIAEEAGIPEKEIGDVDSFDRFSFINVSAELAQIIIESMKGYKHNGRKINIEKSIRSGGKRDNVGTRDFSRKSFSTKSSEPRKSSSSRPMRKDNRSSSEKNGFRNTRVSSSKTEKTNNQ